MFLTALEMQGFKSFPDKTVLKFGKGITGVVGPNGSGKSNISDAVRWVLGEQSSKSLRGARMEDVVFGGTSTRKAMGYAEVSLRLNNTDRTLQMDSDEVIVTRRYYRSGESEYLLNGETVRLKDVHELFMDTGLGRDGYSLVGQGRIADLVSGKSAQRREMLEEAAGIAQFRYRRTDASRRLFQAEENLVRLRDIYAELEDRVGPLKVQSEKAQKFIALSAEKKDLEIGLWLRGIDKSIAGLREQEDKMALVAGQYESVQKDTQNIEAQADEIMQGSRDITLQIEEIRQGAASLEEEAAQIDGRVAVEKNTIEHNNQSIERITQDMEQAADTESHLDERISEVEDQIKALIEQIRINELESETAAKDISGVKEEDTAFAGRAEALSGKIAELTAELSETRISVSTDLSSKEEVTARITAIDEARLSRGETLNQLEENRADSANTLELVREKAEGYQNAVNGYAMRVQSRSAKADGVKKELDALNLDIHQKNARAKMLEDLERNMEGYFGSVKAIMREAKRGTLQGIHGPVSQLISVEDAYAVAVETALGAAVQHIVTDNENNAKRAIEHLKETREGRATFLPLTAIRSRELRERGMENCPGFVDIAHRLVSFDKQYTDIIKSLLALTVVTDNLDNAIAMAKKYNHSFRIVTLDGQVINAGGSMTGGSRGQGAGILSRPNEIENLKKIVADLNKKLSETQAEYKVLSEELSAAQADLDASQADLARTQEEVIRREGELKIVEDRIAAVSASVEELEEEKANAFKRSAALAEAIEEKRKTVAGIEKQIDELKEQSGSLSKEREVLDSRWEELARIQAEIQLKIVAAQKDIQAREESVASLRRRRASHADRLGALNDEISRIAQSSIELKKKIAEMEQRAAQLREESGQSKERVAQLVERRSQLEAQNTELRAKERAASDEREKLVGELARLEERKVSLEKELENAQNKLYEEYQLTRREAEALGIVIEEPAKAQRTLNEIRNKIRALGSVNVGAVEEYKEVSERYEFLGGQIKDIESSRDELNKLIAELTVKMAQQFREEFHKINKHFGETFRELFQGGAAELVLEDPSDILECNIDIKVQPPGKNIQNIDLLSGGEKGLSAIALLFAILKVTPSPFCIFDEVEAALDENNVSIFAKYVRRMTKDIQFILITHRRGTMEEADMLYGVTMQEDGVSKLLELKTAEMAKKLGIA